MFKTLLLASLALSWGCEDGRQGLSGSEPQAAYAASAQQPPDTLRATTRRIRGDDRTDYQVAPLPDGHRFVVTDWWDTGDLAIQDVRTGTLERLTHNTAPSTPGEGMNPRVSRDGKRIAFIWWNADRSKPNELRVMNVDGSDSRTVRRERGDKRSESWLEDWSPDGRWLLALQTLADGTRQIVLLSTEADSVRVLKPLDWRTPTRMNFSADGRFVAYDYPARDNSSVDRDVFVLDMQSGSVSTLVKHPASDFLLGWSPDGKHVLFASDRGGTLGAWLLGVVDGKAVGDPVLLRSDLWGMSEGAFVPDGSFFYRVATGTRGVFVAALDPATGRAVGTPTSVSRGLGADELFPEWSPDGRLLATLWNRDRVPGSYELMIRIRSIEGGEVRDLPLRVEPNPNIAGWAPDGRSLLVRAREKGGFVLARMDVQSGKLEPLVRVAPGVTLGLSRIKPDGRALVYLTGRSLSDSVATRAVMERDLETGRERTICSRSAIRPPRRLYTSLSPDGSTRASFQIDPDEKSWTLVVETIGDLCTGEPRKLLSVPRNQLSGLPGTSWSPDGRFVLYLRRVTVDPDSRSEIWRVPIEGGTPERVGVAMTGLNAQTVSPDGRRIAFTGGEGHDELWVMTNIVPAAAAGVSPRR